MSAACGMSSDSSSAVEALSALNALGEETLGDEFDAIASLLKFEAQLRAKSDFEKVCFLPSDSVVQTHFKVTDVEENGRVSQCSSRSRPCLWYAVM